LKKNYFFFAVFFAGAFFVTFLVHFLVEQHAMIVSPFISWTLSPERADLIVTMISYKHQDPQIRNPLSSQRASQEMMKRKLLFLLRDLLGRSFLFSFLNSHDMILLS